MPQAELDRVRRRAHPLLEQLRVVLQRADRDRRPRVPQRPPLPDGLRQQVQGRHQDHHPALRDQAPGRSSGHRGLPRSAR